MILELYFVLLFMSLALIALGLYANNTALSIVGCGLLLVVGGIMAMDGIQYKTGMTLDDSGTTTTITYNYTDYKNTGLGIVIMLLGFGGVFLSMLDAWRTRQ